jgi:exonuclease SbcC
MRPHLLRFAGIGPYPQEVEINFDELSALGLYLIVGPTGAGKTTIFDAITYALYGKLAGARNSHPIVSDHDNAVQSLVELQFTHRSRRYTLRRRPTPLGKPSRPNDHLLIVHARADEPGSEDVSHTGATRVAAEIEEILGLDASQFNRVMLLPQNEFQQFLLANSSDKEKLLRSLFDTELFHRAGEQIDKTARRLEKEAEASARNLDFLASQITSERSRLVDDGLLPDLDTTGHPDDTSTDAASDSSTESNLAALQELIATELSQARTRSETLDIAAHKATQDRSEATIEAQRYDAAQQLEGLQIAADQDKVPLQLAAEKLKLHSLAVPIANEITRRDSALRELEGTRQLLESAQEAALAVIKVSDWKQPILSQLREAVSSPSTSNVVSVFSQLSATVANSEKNHTAAHLALTQSLTCQADHEKITTQIPVATEHLREISEELSANRDQLALAHTAAEQLPDLRLALQDLIAHEATADLLAPTEALRDIAAEHLAASRSAVIAQEAYENGLATRTKFLAGELAQHLTGGAACPVCGSKEHPTPASISDDAPDLEALADARDETRRHLTTTELTLTDCQNALKTAQLAAQQLPPPEIRQQIRDQHDQTEQLARRVSALSSSMAELVDQCHELQTQITDMTSKATHALNEAERYRMEATNHSSQAEINEELLLTAKEFLEELDPWIEKINELSTQLLGRQPVALHTSQLVASLMTDSEFTDEESVLTSVLDEHLRESLTELQNVAAARFQTMTRLEGVIGDRPPPLVAPDVQALRAFEELRQREARTATEVVTKLSVAQDRCADFAANLGKQGPEASQLQERSARFKEISNILRNGKKPHLALERWVQRAIFEDVCHVASERIKVLSSGRYLLTLDAEDGRQRSHAGGLDLYVIDSHTGRTRPVQTLSGGEQFLTSLALALALAEVVQQMSGGIELASLFIDEGFGSLDGETLDTAVEVLRSLHDSGRSVGVISHVEAMQNDLPVGIRVTPAPTGSSISFPALTRH